MNDPSSMPLHAIRAEMRALEREAAGPGISDQQTARYMLLVRQERLRAECADCGSHLHEAGSVFCIESRDDDSD